MNNKNIVIASLVLTALFIGIIAIMTIHDAYASSKSSRTSTQQNSCGNEDHGRDNTVFMNSTHPG